MEEIKRKLNLLLRAYILDKSNCSDEEIEKEEELIKEIEKELQK